jgi:hypothetical protein
VILYLIKADTFNQVVQLTYTPVKSNIENLKQGIAEEETSVPENEEIKKHYFIEKKLDFIFQAVVLAKNI